MGNEEQNAALAGLESAFNEADERERHEALSVFARRVAHYRTQLIANGVGETLADQLTLHYQQAVLNPMAIIA